MDQLPSTKPYLIRALWEWCTDNGYTPHIAVVVDQNTRVPREYVRDGQIVLNLDSEATNKLVLGNEYIEFQARCSGVARDLSIPVGQVAAIYARENGNGMAFDVTPSGQEDEPTASLAQAKEPPPESPPDKGKPRLQRIK